VVNNFSTGAFFLLLDGMDRFFGHWLDLGGDGWLIFSP